MQRRDFLRNTPLAALAAGTGSYLFKDSISTSSETFPAVRIGIITDLHQDFTFDAPQRLSAFMEDAKKKKVDMIIQLGDFCCPKPENKVIMDLWNCFNGPRYHVIGNHEMDQGFTRSQVVSYWGIPHNYYSFDLKGWHFVVLDGNDHNPAHATPLQYERFIGEQQLKWLVDDLSKTNLPVIVFCHQGLDNYGGTENGHQVRLILEKANERAGYKKVQLAFSGHFHQDYYNQLNGIHHIQVNSAAYMWRGNKYVYSPFSEELNQRYPLLKYMSFYKDPLWAIVDIDGNGKLTMQGRQSSWVGKTPAELGVEEQDWAYPAVSYISDRQIQLTRK